MGVLIFQICSTRLHDMSDECDDIHDNDLCDDLHVSTYAHVAGDGYICKINFGISKKDYQPRIEFEN